MPEKNQEGTLIKIYNIKSYQSIYFHLRTKLNERSIIFSVKFKSFEKVFQPSMSIRMVVRSCQFIHLTPTFRCLSTSDLLFQVKSSSVGQKKCIYTTNYSVLI